jgi:hypothetical protein
VLDKNGMAKAWDVAYQMAELVRLGATVLTMALASYPQDGEEPFLIGRAVKCVNQKALVVAAAGNHGNGGAVAITEGRNRETGQVLVKDPTATAYPAASAGVVAVGAASVETVGGQCTLIPANLTPRVDWVDVWAPGVDQVSTFLEGNVEARGATVDGDNITITAKNLGAFTGFASWSGTSSATGDVSGEIATFAGANDRAGVQKGFDEILSRRRINDADESDIRPANWPGDWDRPAASKA